MGYVIGLGLVALTLWGTWRFYASGTYSATRASSPDLSGFRPGGEADNGDDTHPDPH
jgi:hypothetical protein